MMTELERRALMGDPAAQRECTEKEIVLGCPKCFKPVKVYGPENWEPTFDDPDSGGGPYSFECECGLTFGNYHYDFKEALAKWNERPAPPVGRCKDCKLLKQGGASYGWCGDNPKQFEEFCSNFKPKE